MKRLYLKHFLQLCETFINKNISSDILSRLLVQSSVEQVEVLDYGKGVKFISLTSFNGNLENKHVRILIRDKVIMEFFSNSVRLRDNLKTRFIKIENDLNHLRHELTKLLNQINTFTDFQITGLTRRCSDKNVKMTYRDSIVRLTIVNPVTKEIIFDNSGVQL